MSIFKVKDTQSHEVRDIVTLKTLCLGDVIHCFQFPVKNTKNDPRTLSERPESDKFENKESIANTGNFVKDVHFRSSKHFKRTFIINHPLFF